jgi:hypothetical protein
VPNPVIGIPIAMGIGVAAEYILSRGKASTGDYVAAAVIAPLPIGGSVKMLGTVAKKGKNVYSLTRKTKPSNYEFIDATALYFSPEIGKAAAGIGVSALISTAYDMRSGSTLVDYGAKIKSPGGGGLPLPNKSRRSRRGQTKKDKRRCTHVDRFGRRCTLTKGHLGRHSYGRK